MESDYLLGFLYIVLGVLVPIAQSEQCPPLLGSKTPHGRIKRWSRNKIEVICDESYTIHGSSTLFCYNGNWTGNGLLPKCFLRFRFCQPAAVPQNGRTTGSKQHIGARVRHSCNLGYTLVGSESQVCQKYRQWSGINPQCLSREAILDETSKRLNTKFVQYLTFRNTTGQVYSARILDENVNNVGLDLVLLIDRSSSIDPADFKIGIDFLKALIEEFTVKNGPKHKKGGTRVAAITFGDKADIIFNLDDVSVSSVQAANAKLDSIKPEGGSTALVAALQKVMGRIIPRKKVKKALFIMSDGKPNSGIGVPPAQQAAHLKRNQGYEIFTVGIGKEVNATLLTLMASEPKINHDFHFDKFSDFERVLWLIQNKATPAPPPGPEKCGYISPGEDKGPWLLTVWSELPHGTSFDYKQCTGVLICRKWVLTAAHCFHYYNRRQYVPVKNVVVSVGQKDMTKWEKSGKNIRASEIIIHENFNAADFENDIALLRLEEEVVLSENTKMVCLPRPEIQLSRMMVRNSSIAGWGSMEDKKVTDPPLTNEFFTRNIRASTFLTPKDCSTRSKRLKCIAPSASHFCTESSHLSMKECMVGVGSPVTMTDESGYDNYKRQRVVGIASGYCGKCPANYAYTSHTRIRGYVPWIKKKTKFCFKEHQ